MKDPDTDKDKKFRVTLSPGLHASLGLDQTLTPLVSLSLTPYPYPYS